MRARAIVFLLPFFIFNFKEKNEHGWIRINQLGYLPGAVKVAVLCYDSTQKTKPQTEWLLKDAVSGKTILKGKTSSSFGAYGPFKDCYRIDFSSVQINGSFYLIVDDIRSPVFRISNDVYNGSADFCLRYMRQQRSGFNPFLKDSCHTHDGYSLYGGEDGLPDSTFINVSGGWHDASDYLQYATTSANATYHLLMAYRDFPAVFSDIKQYNGLDGSNGVKDVLDEASWGIDWLLKMFPTRNMMFNQVADDRDHMGMRIPKEDSFYGRGYQRPVYFLNGKPQQRGKFMNNTTGTSSTAGKFSGVFALAQLLVRKDGVFKKHTGRLSYYDKAFDAFAYANRKPGVSQTASVRSPYIYAEENWVDDMELASVLLHELQDTAAGDHGYYLVKAVDYAKKEPVTPWFGTDTAKHYQWYPFVNTGRYELLKEMMRKHNGPVREAGYTKEFVEGFWKNTDTLLGYYKDGINRVWQKAKNNAFYRGIPYIWCSNNLTVSFAIQCYWYRQLTGDRSFLALEQANFDWIFGCNPWGTSMVYGLPAKGDTPSDPHSAFTHLKNYPIDGGLVDGPVYTSIYKNLIGIKLYEADEYAQFQSGLAVYHDDYGDYSTNEPTMDGTASLIYLLAAKESEGRNPLIKNHGAITRGDTSKKQVALVFTGDEFGEGADEILAALEKENVPASFFFTGRFLSNPGFRKTITSIRDSKHYIGPHSDQHLLYCDWIKRDSMLVTRTEFENDLRKNYEKLGDFGINKEDALYFIPPYEWYNDSIAAWTSAMGIKLVNYTPGTISHADYTPSTAANYRNNDIIYHSIFDYETRGGLNGFILLMHIGAGPGRLEKFYHLLPRMLKELRMKGYEFKRVDELLEQDNIH